MIEATCTACGTTNRVPEADIPTGAKFVSCSSCRARVALPAQAPLGGALPRGPANRPPTSPDTIELADLPAPRRASPLAGAGESKPAAKSGLGALDLDLPAPKPKASELPAPKLKAATTTGPNPIDAGPRRGEIDLGDLGDDLLGPPGASELPAPKPRAKPPTDPGNDAGRMRGGSTADGQRGEIDIGLLGKPDLPDLPAPKAPPPRPSGPIPRAPGLATPVAALPSVRPSVPAIPPARQTGPIGGGSIDLPAAKLKAPTSTGPNPIESGLGGLDLPAAKPKAASAAATGPSPIDLPAPRGAVPNLPTPKAEGPRGLSDLPTPKTPSVGIEDVPAPKGFFDDLPQPAKASKQQPADKGPPELPAPKGFFDDLPQPAKSNKPELPAPKGFFDDLPGRVPQKSDVPAPKGFFDDLPGKPGADKAPGFFDDLPAPTKPKFEPKPAPAATGPSLDLALDGSEQPIDLALEGSSPALDIGKPPASIVPAKGQFDDLDLSSPTAAPVRTETPKRVPVEPLPPAPLPPVSLAKSPDSLDLEEPRNVSQRLAPKKEKTGPVDDPQAKLRRQKRTRLIGLGIVVALALGGGGLWFMKRRAAAAERKANIEQGISTARTSLAAADAKHWERAAGAAGTARGLDPTNPAALGLFAEASFASALSDGTNGAGKINAGKAAINEARTAAVTGPELLRAQALQAVVENRTTVAIPKLEALVKAAPKDARLALYLGWAYATGNQVEQALAQFSRAAEDGSTKVPALYGRGLAKRAMGDAAGAAEDFRALLAVAKDHVAAQVALAASLPPSQASQQESDLLAILQRKDIKSADPRAVAEAWVLAGDIAMRGGRFDPARERYRSALKVVPNHVPALTGLAIVELKDGKLDAAGKEIAKAVAQNKDDFRAQLVTAEIELAQKALGRAEQRLKLLAERPAPSKADAARLQMVTGLLLEQSKQPLPAVEAYAKAADLGGETALPATLEAVRILSALAAEAAPEVAQGYRTRSDELLAKTTTAAEADPALALTLGTAYLQMGDATKAEPWLRKASAANAADVEAQYQLARALQQLGKTDEALALLTKVYEADATRTEVGLELARTFEAAKKDAEAGAMYEKLVEAKDASIELRARAGRFWARTGRIDLAAKQGDAILAIEPDHAAGMYLRGEGLLAAGKPEEAKKELTNATARDKDAQFLDALGRACEALYTLTNDSSNQDVAIRVYTDAHALDPEMYNPVAGLGRLYVARNEARKALEPLTKAVKLQPTNHEPHYLMGRVSKELGNLDMAIQWFESSRDLKPTAEAAYELGGLYNDKNKGAQAAAAFDQATRLGAEQEKATGLQVKWLTDAYYALGETNLRVGKEAEAAAAWHKFIDRKPPPGPRLDEVKRTLLTTLQAYQRP